MDQDRLLDILEKRYSTDNKGDYFHVTTSLTAGVVVDTDDPLQNGRLRVFCPAHGDDPAKIHLLPWAVYVSPFGGTVCNDKFERQGETTSGSVSYGFWAIPEMGANVLVGCVDGDLRRRFWIGTMYDQQETHTLGNGRYNWKPDGTVEGPLSSSGDPIEPLYSNSKTAFNGNNGSPEWQSREAEYSMTAVDKSLNQPPTPDKISYLDQQQKEIAQNQQFSFNKAIVGSNGYDWSSFGIPFKTNKTFGLTSPGFASLIMDDRQFNNKVKLRSSTGHVILLDDTNERIYIRTNTGNAWVELDKSGNIDAYSARRISLKSDMDINLTASKTVRINGGEGVFIYSGGVNDNPELSSAPAIGQVRIQSSDDLHLVGKNIRELSFEKTIFEIGTDKCESIGGSSFTQVQNDINLISNAGDYNTMIFGDYNLAASGKITELSVDSSHYESNGNIDIHSYSGNTSINGENGINLTTTSNISMTATGNFTSNSMGITSISSVGTIAITSSTSVVISPPASAAMPLDLSIFPSKHTIETVIPKDVEYPILFGASGGEIVVNNSVVTGMPSFPTGAFPAPVVPATACLSAASSAPWTNRVPDHEPWPRTMMGNTAGSNTQNDECNYNTGHNPQFTDDNGGIGSYSINRVEGTDTITRNQFWRR